MLVFAVANPASAKTTKLRGVSKCVDATGDGQGADLGTTTLTADNKNLLTVRWETPVPLSGPGEVEWLMDIAGPKGKPAYEIGLKRNGNTVTKFLFNISTNRNTKLTTAANITDQGAALVVPLSKLPGLGKHPTWYVTLIMGGRHVDACPAGALETVKF